LSCAFEEALSLGGYRGVMLWAAEELRSRLSRARESLGEHDWSAMVVTPGADLRYFTGYDALLLERLTCLVLPAAGDAILVVPRLERAAAEQAPIGDLGIRLVDYPDGGDPCQLAAAGLAPGRVAVGGDMPARHLLALQRQLPSLAWVDASAGIAGLRAVKSDAEIGALAEAAAAIDEVHRGLHQWLRAGRTEQDVAADIAEAMRATGHARADFVIVASGPNAASPHHSPGTRRLEDGDPVVVDIGGTMPSGYCSDCTRTYLLGSTPPPGFADYYQVLHAAQRAAVAAVAPGVPAEAVDAAARTPISEAGHGAAFLHRTGHGIGLDTHEDPYIVTGNVTPLREGMAFSVEPGIYQIGQHGARIEDIVVCTATGVRRLNATSTDLVHL
jgi:Xaa-Pro aminopeptidase